MKLNKSTISKVKVSAATVGENLQLCAIYPYHEYVNNAPTDTILGYSYTVICPGLMFNKLSVKIPGKPLLDENSCGHFVKFANLKLKLYPTYFPDKNGISVMNLSASADNVTVING